ncbi:DUF2802 domain-containing protein [Thalassotalea atypica]|uniref:DUF2802 domain-containing protein n=1 Tax=Thalassotalea atypica TaxID=2054316 RepID=UPI002573448E|nr:DUF2802 domain-containing protein [Thalassotalea atypica]
MQWLYSIQPHVAALLVVIILIFILFVRLKKISQQYSQLDISNQASELVLEDLQHHQQILEEKLNNLAKTVELKSQEDIQVSKQFEHRIKTVKKELSQMQTVIDQVKSQEPQDKLYSRAYKLAALGAGIEEIMTECELPKAEVEMLLSVYKPK